jgi:hypothetical protein
MECFLTAPAPEIGDTAYDKDTTIVARRPDMQRINSSKRNILNYRSESQELNSGGPIAQACSSEAKEVGKQSI